MAGTQGGKTQNIPSDFRLKSVKLPNGRYDKEALKFEWITTGISLTGLAKKYGISPKTLYGMYYKNRWSIDLAKYKQTRIEEYEKMMKQKAVELAERTAIIDDRVINLCEDVLDGLEDKINELKNDGEDVDIHKVISSFKSATDAISKAHTSARLASGKSTANIDAHTQIKDIPQEDEERIAKEYGFIKDK